MIFFIVEEPLFKQPTPQADAENLPKNLVDLGQDI